MDGRGLNSGYFDKVDDGGWKGKKTNSNPVFYGEMVPFLLQLGKELADFRCLPSGSVLRKSIKPSTINKTKQTKSPCPPFLALRMGD